MWATIGDEKIEIVERHAAMLPMVETRDGRKFFVAPSLEWAKDKFLQRVMYCAENAPGIFVALVDNFYELPWGDSLRYISRRYDEYRRGKRPVWSVYVETEQDWQELQEKVRNSLDAFLGCQPVPMQGDDRVSRFIGFEARIAFVPYVKNFEAHTTRNRLWEAVYQ